MYYVNISVVYSVAYNACTKLCFKKHVSVIHVDKQLVIHDDKQSFKKVHTQLAPMQFN